MKRTLAVLVLIFAFVLCLGVVIPQVPASISAFMRTLLDDLTGADARTTLDAAKKVEINVTDAPYNATGDGETDDYAAIQAAITAAPSGSTIVFPPGTYITGTPLTFKAYIRYKGTGHRYCQLRASSTNSASIFTFGGIAHVIVEGLTFSSANTSAYMFKSTSLTDYYMDYVTFRDCDFYCDHHTSIYATFGFIKFERCRFGYLGTPGAYYRAIYGGDVTEAKYIFSTSFESCWFYHGRGADAMVELITGNTAEFDSCVWQSCTIPAYRSQGIRNTLMVNCDFENIEPSVDTACEGLIQLWGMPVSLVPGDLLMVNGWFQNNGASNESPWTAVAHCTTSGADAKASFDSCSGNFGSGYWTVCGGVYDKPSVTDVRRCNVVNNSNSTYDTAHAIGSKANFYSGLGARNGATSAGFFDFYEDSDNGSNRVRVYGPASTADAEIHWPDSTELAETGYLHNDGSGNLSIETPAGSGDMEKSTYDVAENGVVDGDNTAYNATTWNDNPDAASKDALRDKIEALPGGHDPVTIGTANGLSLSTQELSLAAGTNTTPGAITAAQVTALEAIDTEAELEALLEVADLQGELDPDRLSDEDQGDVAISGDVWTVQAIDSTAVANIAKATGDTYTGTHDLSGATVTGPARIKGTKFYLDKTIALPNALYDSDTQWSLVVQTPAALTITSVKVSCDADPATELDWDLKFADAFIGLANATVIVAMDTTAGVATISSGWTDNTVPASKCIYFEFGADPIAAITQIGLQIEGDYD